MLVASYRKKGVRISHVWFMEPENLPNIETDIFFVHGVDQLDKRLNQGSIITPQNTLLTDLSENEEAIMANYSKTIRYQIRRAQKDDLSVSIFSPADLLSDREVIQEFGCCYENMYAQKGIRARFNYDVVKAYIEAQTLLVTTAAYKGIRIVFHSYVFSPDRARLLHTVSTFRDAVVDHSVMARANKYLHHQDILHFKALGAKVYDWGGVYDFDEPSGVDWFKMEFGGSRHTYLNVIKGRSVIGKTLIAGKKALDQIISR